MDMPEIVNLFSAIKTETCITSKFFSPHFSMRKIIILQVNMALNQLPIRYVLMNGKKPKAHHPFSYLLGLF